MGSILRHIRSKQRATLAEVAERAKLSESFISRVERGERHPNREKLIGLLLGGLGQDVPQANLILQLAGYAEMYAQARAKSAMWRPEATTGPETEADFLEIRP